MSDRKLPKATNTGTLTVAGVSIPCAVLDNGWRVLTTRGMLRAIGRSDRQEGGPRSAEQTPPFLTAKNLQPFWDNGSRVPSTPLQFVVQGGVAHGYRAELLADVCSVYLEARRSGKLLPHQEHVAQRCEVLVLAFAKVGITALVDEATGYKKRQREYAELIEMLIAKELQPWVKRFPDEFFKEMCRLRGWEYVAGPLGLPRCVGHDINRFVYSRLPGDVREELRRLASEKDSAKIHQGLSDNYGVKWLDRHLTAVITMMQLSHDWKSFKRKFKTLFPKAWDQTELLLDELEDE